MGYVVVTGQNKKSALVHAVAVDHETYSVVGDYGFVGSSELVKIMYNGGSQLTPLNFSLDRAGQIKQDCGDFSRFSQHGSAVVLAEIKTKGGRTLGYRLLSCINNVCVNLRLEEVLQREKSMPQGEHFLQNGIIRNNTVNSYPFKPFPVLQVEGVVPKRPVKLAPPSKPEPKPAGIPPQKPSKPPKEFTVEQQKELTMCRNAGVNPRFIGNPKLSPAQMRVLWVAKSKGCLAESFADPRFPADAMKFYADRLYDKQTVIDCSELLAHPELDVEQLNELYACVCQGVPYSELIGMSATDVSVKREMAVRQYWGSSLAFENDYVEKAINVAGRINREK